MTRASRRDFLHRLIAGAGIAALRPAAGAAAAFSATRLSDSLTLISGAGGNVVVAGGADGLLLANGGAPAHASALLAELARQFGGRPVRTLITTDWHPDHNGLNGRVARGGGTVIAHEYTKQYLGRAGMKDSLPTKTFYSTGRIDFGGETIEYGSLGQAHTDGDIYVFFRGGDVIAAGDLLASGRYPIADVESGGWLGGMVTAVKSLLDLSTPDTRFVPGTGAVLTRADVEAEHRMLTAVRERFVKMMRQGMSASDMLAAGMTKDFDAAWGDPSAFIVSTYRGMWLHVRELGGIV